MWHLLLEPINDDDTVWIVSAIETDDADNELGRVAEKVKGDQAAAEVAGQRLIKSTLEVRNARSRAVEIAVDTAVLDPPAPGWSEAEVARRRTGLERTKRVLDETVGEIANLTEQLTNAEAKRASLEKSIADEEASLAEVKQ